MAEPRWLDDDEMRLWRSFLAVVSGTPSAIDADLRKATDISHDDYEVLVHLSEADDHRLRMADLSRALLHSRSRLSQRVDRLSARGWVERVKCEHDARGTFAQLTPAGYDALAAAAPLHVEHVRTHLIDRLDPDQVKTLADVLEHLASQLRD